MLKISIIISSYIIFSVLLVSGLSVFPGERKNTRYQSAMDIRKKLVP